MQSRSCNQVLDHNGTLGVDGVLQPSAAEGLGWMVAIPTIHGISLDPICPSPCRSGLPALSGDLAGAPDGQDAA